MNRTNPFQKYYDLINSSATIPDFPYLLDVELTNNCNLRCRFCRNGYMTRPRGYMNDVVFETIVDEARDHDCGIRLIRWGEPTLHKNIVEYVKYAHLCGVPVHLTTNGTADPDVYIALMNAGLDSIIFSMQGATKEEYEKQRVGLDASHVYGCIDLLELERADLELPYIQISSTMTDDDSQDDIDAFRQGWSDVADNVVIGKTVDYSGGVDKTPCYDMRYKLAVDWNGDISACCADYDGALTLANIKTSSIDEMWRDHYLARWREILAAGRRDLLTPCSSCRKAY